MRTVFCTGLGLAVLVGCGRSGPPRADVSGRVTYQGRPVETGHIKFVPEGDSAATVGGGHVEGGRYRVTGDAGLMPGRYKVQVNWAEMSGPPAPGPRPWKELIPAKYNAKTELTLDVPAGTRTLTQDYELK